MMIMSAACIGIDLPAKSAVNQKRAFVCASADRLIHEQPAVACSACSAKMSDPCMAGLQQASIRMMNTSWQKMPRV